MNDATSSNFAQSNEQPYSFIVSIAHDLKNLMTPILSRSEMLLLPNLPKEKLNSILRELNSNCLALMDALNNVVTISKARSNLGEYSATKFNIRFMVIEAIDFLQERIDQKSIRVLCDVPEDQYAYGDSVMIASVICNLLSNAVKFTRDCGHVSIRSALENGFVRISVIDDGVGLDVFKIRQLIDNSQYFSTVGTHGETGSGLGLMLCSSQLRRNNTELEFSNNPSGGATFSFLLPCGD